MDQNETKGPTMTPNPEKLAGEAIEQLMSEGACVIDEESARNVEDDDLNACVVISIALRDKIVAALRNRTPDGARKESRNAIVEECARVADHFAMICTETTTAEKDERGRKRAAQVAEAIRALVLREGGKGE